MAGPIDPAQYWGLDPKTAGSLPLGLRSSNNLFNIKYVRGAERNQQKWPGLIGASSARDQGDPQMLFRDPEDSGVAAAQLLRRKYDSGMRTPAQIIAGPMGWTPGRGDSAAAVAKYAGVNPNDDLRLDTPEGMKRFLPALATQEHGTWARDNVFSKRPELFDRILQRYLGMGVPPAQAAAAAALAVPQDPEMPGLAPGAPQPTRAAPLATGSTTPATGAAPMASPYTGPSPDDVAMQRKMALALMQQGGSTEPVQHWTQALARVLQGGVGGMYQNQARQGEQQGTQSLVAALSGGQPNVGAMVANPWSRELGMKLAQSQFAQNTPAAQAELQGQQLQNQLRQRELNKPEDDGSKLMEVNGQIIRVPRQGEASVAFGSNPVEQRRQQVIGAGMDPNSPSAKVFIASGKMPREDQQPLTATDKKAILEADEMVMTTQGVIKNLDDALKLSSKAYTGPTAGARGYVSSFFGSEGGQATEELNNLITQNALQQLKATFGAAPTEGERKILLEIQGSVNKAPEIRKAIYDRAKALAERRLDFYRKRAEEMRGQTYFKAPGDGKAPAAEAAPGKRLKYNPATGELE